MGYACGAVEAGWFDVMEGVMNEAIEQLEGWRREGLLAKEIELDQEARAVALRERDAEAKERRAAAAQLEIEQIKRRGDARREQCRLDAEAAQALEVAQAEHERAMTDAADLEDRARHGAVRAAHHRSVTRMGQGSAASLLLAAAAAQAGWWAFTVALGLIAVATACAAWWRVVAATGCKQ